MSEYRDLYVEGQEVVAAITCPNDGEATNLRCWKCGWQPSPAVREQALRDAAPDYMAGGRYWYPSPGCGR